jgi:hypothetical protein
MGCAIAAELSGLVLEFGLVVLVLWAVRTVTPPHASSVHPQGDSR